MLPPSSLNHPRLAGAKEHYERARLFIRLANQQPDQKDAFRLRIAAITECRAIIETMLESAEMQDLVEYRCGTPRTDRANYEANLVRLPHYKLIEHMRIHDFHRFGLIPPASAYRALRIGGPIKITAQRGAGVVQLGEQGLETSATGNTKIALQRPLIEDDGKFLDEETGRYFSPEDIAKAFLDAVLSKIEEFERAIC